MVLIGKKWLPFHIAQRYAVVLLLNRMTTEQIPRESRIRDWERKNFLLPQLHHEFRIFQDVVVNLSNFILVLERLSLAILTSLLQDALNVQSRLLPYCLIYTVQYPVQCHEQKKGPYFLTVKVQDIALDQCS